jgi:hypothetical protein
MELIETTTIQVPRVLDRQSLRQLRAHLGDCGGSAVVLRGSSEVFCEGMDLEEFDTAPEVRSGLEEYAACLEALRTYPRATIAVVEGRAFAGGIGLVAACDLALSSEEATFGLSELLFGMMPAVVFPFLLERVRPQKARLWALAARPWKGNVRELENALERAMVLGGGELLALADLSVSEDPATAPVAHPRDLREAIRQFERRHLIDVLDEAGLDKRKAADLLGISLASLYRKLSLAPDRSPPPAEDA